MGSRRVVLFRWGVGAGVIQGSMLLVVVVLLLLVCTKACIHEHAFKGRSATAAPTSALLLVLPVVLVVLEELASADSAVAAKGTEWGCGGLLVAAGAADAEGLCAAVAAAAA
eukprot:scaffold298584_cov20-Tisochrysis_lutea.AAC.2